MSDHDPIHLSAQGEHRRRQIGDALLQRARARRTGRTFLAGVASLALVGGAAVLARSLVSSRATPATQPIVHHTPVAPTPTPTTDQPAIQTARIVIFTNEPISDRPCSALQSSSAAAAPSQVSVCILNDQQLLSALSTTGESYGLVRVGGRTEVVRNTR